MVGLTKFYTGVGSRETPDHILVQMYKIAQYMALKNWCLRSGGAPGADTAFEIGCIAEQGTTQIFLPWKGFNRNPSPFYNIPPEAFVISREVYGPRLDFLKRPVHLLMARNVLQVLGHTLDQPSAFVVCWTQDGALNGAQRTKQTGGTGQAIAIASRYNVPVFNLAKHTFEDVYEFVETYDDRTTTS